MLCLTSDPNEDLEKGTLKTSLTEVFGASGEMVYSEEPTEVEEKIFKIGYTIGKIAITRDLKHKIYVYNKNGSGHPKGQEYTVYPETIYIKELRRSVNIDMNEPIDIEDMEEEYSSVSEGEVNISETITSSSDEDQMQVTTDETDESDGEELTLREVAERMNIRGHYYQHGVEEDDSQVKDQEAIHETCNKQKRIEKKKQNAAEAKFIAPSMDFFMCESCEEKFENRMALGIHQKDCVEWERELAFYEMTGAVGEKDIQSKGPNMTGMDRIKSLADQIEEINQKQEKCASDGCKITEKYSELSKCAKALLGETVSLIQEKNKSLYFKSLIIEQLQTLKKKDDREIILHRERLVNCLDMMCKLERNLL